MPLVLPDISHPTELRGKVIAIQKAAGHNGYIIARFKLTYGEPESTVKVVKEKDESVAYEAEIRQAYEDHDIKLWEEGITLWLNSNELLK